MEDMIRVVAVPDRRVIDPLSRRVMDANGILVSRHDPAWARLIADGDVVVADEPAADAPARKSAKE